MADPVSIISAVATIGSAVMGVVAPIIQSRNEAAIMKGNAALMMQQAKDREVQSSIAAERERRRNRRLMAEQEAGAAESGALSGSSLDLLDQNSVAMELDALTVEYNGMVDATSMRNRAGMMRAEASNIKRGGIIGAIGGGLSGVAKAAGGIDGLNF